MNLTTRVEIDGILGFFVKTVTRFGTSAKVDCPKEFVGRTVINVSSLLTSLGALERFTNDALVLRYHSGYLGEFHYNKDILRAAVANTYFETLGTRSDSIHLAIEKNDVKETVEKIRKSLISRITALTRKFIPVAVNQVMIAVNYTHEDFYGDRDSLWIHGWTG